LTVVTLSTTLVAGQPKNGLVIGVAVVGVGVWFVCLVDINGVNLVWNLGGKSSLNLGLIVVLIRALLTGSLGVSWELRVAL